MAARGQLWFAAELPLIAPFITGEAKPETPWLYV